jgi:hypothetical protein
MLEIPDGNAEGAAESQPAPGAWVFAFGAWIIILILMLLYLLFRLWPGRLPFNGEGHSVVNLIPGLWTPDVWVEARYLVLVAVMGDKDRRTVLPETLKDDLIHHLAEVRTLYDQDRSKNLNGVYLPDALPCWIIP